MSYTSFTLFASGIVLAACAWLLQRRSGGQIRLRYAARLRPAGAPRPLTLAAAFVMAVCGFQAVANASVANEAQKEKGSDIARTATDLGNAQAPHQPSRDYAARQAQSKHAENFEGGSTTIVIGSSALIVILVVLLIVVIL
jgi:hypothetical protein